MGALGFKKLNIDASLGRPSASLAPLYMRHFRSDFNPLCFQSVPPTSFLASSFCRILFIYIFTTRNDDRAARLRITYTTTTCYYCLLRTKKELVKQAKNAIWTNWFHVAEFTLKFKVELWGGTLFTCLYCMNMQGCTRYESMQLKF